MSGQHWNVFGHCPTCKARPGAPCMDLRARIRPQYTKRAHRDREQLTVPLLPGETR